MKKTLLFTAGLFALGCTFSQTSLFTEDFESGTGGFTLNTATQSGVSGTTGANYWIVNGDYAGGAGTVMTCAPLAGFAFTIPATTAQPGGISSANGGYLHIISAEAVANGITSTSYSPAENTLCVFSASHFTEMTADVNTTAYTGVTFDFWWLNNNGTGAPGELWYSIDGGSNWTQKTGTNFYGSASWTNTTLTDASWDGQATLRFGFRFDNINSTGAADPALAIDDVEISGTGAACSDNTSSFTASSCISYTVPSGDETYTASGTYTVMDTINNIAGCDSVMTISLTLDTVNIAVTDNLDGTATAASTGGTFQWLDCGNGNAPIAGATAATYAPTIAGNYSVEITDNGCVDTSACIALTPLSIEQYSNSFSIYPNPSEGNISIDLSGLNGMQNLTITDLNGRIVHSTYINGSSVIELNLNLESGAYLVSLSDNEGVNRKARLLIEK